MSDRDELADLRAENALLRDRLAAIGHITDTGKVAITVERFHGRTWYSLDPHPQDED